VLAEHWANVAIQRTFFEWSDAPHHVSTQHWRRVYFAWRRVYRIRSLIGDIVDRAIDHQVKKFFAEHEAASWEPGIWNEFLRLIDGEAQKKHLAPIQ